MQETNKASQYDYLFKFILVGDSSVGKSCLLLQFTNQKFKQDHQPTIGVEFGSKLISNVKLQVWDTSGLEQFKSITRSYYRNTIGALILYDITRRQTFNSISKWLEEIKNQGNPHLTILIVGNKNDLVNRVVQQKEGYDMATKYGAKFIEISSKNYQRVDFVFKALTQQILQKIKDGKINLEQQNIGIKVSNNNKAI